MKGNQHYVTLIPPNMSLILSQIYFIWMEFPSQSSGDNRSIHCVYVQADLALHYPRNKCTV